jgi:hypothetical protein
MSTFDPSALEAKARLYIERALGQPRESSEFAFWCHLAVEPLARAAIANVNPVLLADGKTGTPAINQAAALGIDVPGPVTSAALNHVLALCPFVLPTFFANEEQAAARRLAVRRNDELHTGNAAFEALALSDWYTDFVRVIRALAGALGLDLADLLGDDEAGFAESELVEEDAAISAQVKQAIGRARHRAAQWSEAERAHRAAAIRAIGSSAGPYEEERECPACGAPAVVRGDIAFRGPTRLDGETNELFESLVIVPGTFRCPLCELHLDDRRELRAARVGDPFTIVSDVDPVEFHGIDVAEEAERAGLYVVDPQPEYEDE